MRLLLDTHTFQWFLEDSAQLSSMAKALIEDGGNDVYISIGSLWEMAIKISLGKLSVSQPFEIFIPEQLTANDMTLLPIAVEHTVALITLPFHYRDPFGRLLIAQSLVTSMPIVGADTAFDAYGVQRLW
ncbi:MAG TPA: type II toxin-antitoxin system VapC family toxin [Ktedonobacterales bacterium]|nr:type II toxin-antitoxin system VapC family toxin [Ktedonobacterales bacterium]